MILFYLTLLCTVKGLDRHKNNNLRKQFFRLYLILWLMWLTGPWRKQDSGYQVKNGVEAEAWLTLFLSGLSKPEDLFNYILQNLYFY